MHIFNFLAIIFFSFSWASGLNIVYSNDVHAVNSGMSTSLSDTIKDNHILFNGRVWRNRYNRIMEDQFLYSKDFLKASITIGGKTFTEVPLRYDIYNDEISAATNQGLIIQLNKEMVDSFSINFQNSYHLFTKIQGDSLQELKGYVNLLYARKSSLYVKYKKEIELLAVEKKYDRFFQTQKIYFVKDNIAYQISGKRKYFKVIGDYKIKVRAFIKKNNIKVSRKEPESFVPVIQYYDSLRQ